MISGRSHLMRIENGIFFQIKSGDLIMLNEMICMALANGISNMDSLDWVQHAFDMDYLATIFVHSNV